MDKSVCRLCNEAVPAKRANTTNLFRHLQDHHADIYATVPDKNNLREARKVHAKIHAKICVITQISRGVDYVLTRRKNMRVCMFTCAQKYFIIIVIKSRASTC